MRTNSYWDSNGKYQQVYGILEARIPGVGEVPNARTTNKKLDRLRRASNCYYDLFNNGLCNRAEEFRRIFGRGGKEIVINGYRNTQWLEEAMDKIIEEAAKEQGVAL